jgi:hypothetical protein
MVQILFADFCNLPDGAGPPLEPAARRAYLLFVFQVPILGSPSEFPAGLSICPHQPDAQARTGQGFAVAWTPKGDSPIFPQARCTSDCCRPIGDGDAEVTPAGLWGGSCTGHPQTYLCLRWWKSQLSRLSGDLFHETATSERFGRKTRGGDECKSSLKKGMVCRTVPMEAEGQVRRCNEQHVSGGGQNFGRGWCKTQLRTLYSGNSRA